MRRSAAVAVLVIAVALAGCVGDTGPTENDTPDNATDGNTTDDLPETDGSTTDLPHVHDRWDGDDQKVVFDGTVTTGSTTDTDPRNSLFENLLCVVDCASEAELTLPEGHIIPPGTDRVVVDADWGTPPGDTAAPLHVDLLYQAANMSQYDYHSELSEPGSWSINTTVEMADGGHAEGSLWAFLFNVHRHDPAFGASLPRVATSGFDVDVTVTAYRVDGELPREPPHPDWWANGSRVLHEGNGSGTATGAGQLLLAQGETGEFLDGTEHGVVPPGTARLTMTINWTNEAATSDASPVRPYARFSTELTFDGIRAWEPTTTEQGRYEYELVVRTNQTDGHYADRSRWLFQWFLAGQRLPVDDPLTGQPMTQPWRFDGDWTSRIVAYPNATEA